MAGHVEAGWVYISKSHRPIAESLGLDEAVGALVSDITAGGPADEVIKAGDVILSFNGQKIERMRDLPFIVTEQMLINC